MLRLRNSALGCTVIRRFLESLLLWIFQESRRSLQFLLKFTLVFTHFSKERNEQLFLFPKKNLCHFLAAVAWSMAGPDGVVHQLKLRLQLCRPSPLSQTGTTPRRVSEICLRKYEVCFLFLRSKALCDDRFLCKICCFGDPDFTCWSSLCDTLRSCGRQLTSIF